MEATGSPRVPVVTQRHRRPAFDPSSDQTIRNHLEEDAAHGYSHAIVVSTIDSAKLPAATSVIQILKKAVPGAGPRLCLRLAAAVLLT
jgi:hypothetical protein